MSSSTRSLFVRDATPTDSEVVERFMTLSRTESLQYRGSTFDPPVSNTNETLTLVGGIGTTVMGTLRAVGTVPGTWFIEQVFVLKECREVGIADALMLRALAVLSDRHATRIESSAMPGDRATKNLFERHGLVAQTILVGKSLSDPSTEARASQ